MSDHRKRSRDPALAKNFFASAIECFRTGRLNDAERRCRDALTADAGHFEALHLLGIIAAQTGNHKDASKAFTQVTALQSDYLPAHIALGTLAGQRNDLPRARAAFERALAIDSAAVEALNGAANVAFLEGRMQDAAQLYRAVVAQRPSAETHNNIGLALAALGRWQEATDEYRQALSLKPGPADVHLNLGHALLAQGEPAQALAAVRQRLRYGETPEAKLLFVQCLTSLPEVPSDQDLRQLVARALTEAWRRPTRLASFVVALFKKNPAVKRLIERADLSVPALAEVLAADGIVADPLFRALLISAPVPDGDLERLLTAMRSAVVQEAVAAQADAAGDPAVLELACVLARQCFINEYVFAESDAYTSVAAQLRERVDSALAGRTEISPLQVAALGCCIPLNRLVHAKTLATRSWPAALKTVLDQQIDEPQQEQDLRATIPALTDIDDDVSRKVQGQYEEMPYPRWVKTSPAIAPVTLDMFLRTQFPAAPIRTPGRRSDRLDVLIAGCGTGQHPIETAQRLAGAQVLAVDLSMTSLAYAARKTREHGLKNITYGQADLLRLGALKTKFDLIEAIGSLQCLREPEAGWRILVSLLRPNGFMHVGLYSAHARANIRAAWQFIADRGYGDTAADIRRGRQELLACEDGSLLKSTTQSGDFYSISGCRDLLFHVQEDQTSIPAIKAFLENNGLTFLGFSGIAMDAFRTRFPDEKASVDLDCWNAFEQDNPRTFAGLYLFWVQKAAD